MNFSSLLQLYCVPAVRLRLPQSCNNSYDSRLHDPSFQALPLGIHEWIQNLVAGGKVFASRARQFMAGVRAIFHLPGSLKTYAFKFTVKAII
jgi:hypothetical protein